MFLPHQTCQRTYKLGDPYPDNLDEHFGPALSPNPTCGQLNVAWDQEGWLVVVNMAGVEVFHGQHEGGGQVLDLSALPKGLYLIRWRSTAGKEGTARLVLQ